MGKVVGSTNGGMYEIRVGGGGGSSSGGPDRRCGGGAIGGGGGSLNPFNKPRHPKVPHGVLELLAVHVTFELLGMLLYPSSPIVFDLIISSSGQILGYFRPSVIFKIDAKLRLENLKFTTSLGTN